MPAYTHPALLWLGLCIACGAAAVVLHFWMRIRLLIKGIPVRWYVQPRHDYHMWESYRRFYAARPGPISAFYLFYALLAGCIVFGIAFFVTAS